MDVEGAEFAILRHLIRRGVIGRVRKLYVEWHDRLLTTESTDSHCALEQDIRAQGVELIRWG